MTNTTIAADIKSQHRGLWFVLVSLCLHIIVLGTVWHFDFLGVTHLDTQPQEEQPLREIALKQLHKERAEQQKQKLPEEHAQKLVKEEEQRTARDMIKKVKVLEKQNIELEKIRQMKLEEIKAEPREAVKQRLLEKAKALEDRAHEIIRYEKTEPLKKLSDQSSQVHNAVKYLKPEDDPKQRESEKKLDDALNQFEETAQQIIDNKQSSNTEKRLARELLKQQQEIKEQMPGLDDPGQRPNVVQAQQMLDQAPPPTRQTDEQTLEQMPPEQLYDQAKALEQKADKTYTDIKTAEMALQQNGTLEQAKQNISHTPPARPELGKALAQQKEGMQTRKDLAEFRQQLDKTAREVDAMKVATADKLTQAQGMARMSQAMGRQSPQQQFRARAMMNQFASGRQANVDMSQMMRQMSMGMGIGTETGMGLGNSSDHRITEGGRGTYADPDDIAPTNIKGINIPSTKVMAQALPGQKFNRSSARHGWLYLDTWYIIGPWENNGKLDHRDIFPPELSIDFDATYQGKAQTHGPDKGKPMQLRWQFTQSGRIQVVPPDERSNAVYYAYTEIHFEEDTDMLLAVASDDSSKLWINDIVVWDDKTHSDWRIGEGSRKVFFHKGYNRMLLRLENRGAETEFSVLICPPTFKQ
jgi:hypothetical protein